MTGNEARVVEAIMDICFEKEASDRRPLLATSKEVAERTGMRLSEISDIARSLKKSGKLRVGRTLNFDYYMIKTTGNDMA